MKTYQDLLELGDSSTRDDARIKDFLISAMNAHKSSDAYLTAKEADAYDKQQNTTIMTYQKLLYTISGQPVRDKYSANHKIASNFYNRFNVQENQYLLGNGVTFEKEDTKDKLGTRKLAFDTQLQKLGKLALTHGVSFGFFNLDHIDIFDITEFIPLRDEEDGALKAGIRFWQIDDKKPLRMTLYEMDGYTEYIRRSSEDDITIYMPKRPYVLKTRTSKVDGMQIYDGENYPGFPIVPLWGNQDHVCRIKGWKYSIDCYDLIKSGFANDIDDASLIYWTIENAGGMDDIDLAEFVQRMKTVKAAVVMDDGAHIESHTQDIPVDARNSCLTRLEKDLYKDAMALDTEAIANGNTVATAIRAAYEPLNNKTDDFEYCVIEFIQNILDLAGIEDDPSFNRSTVINQTEETNMVLSAGQYLDDETILRHLPFLSTDEIDEILLRKDKEEADRFAQLEDMNDEGQGETTDGQETE